MGQDRGKKGSLHSPATAFGSVAAGLQPIDIMLVLGATCWLRIDVVVAAIRVWELPPVLGTIAGARAPKTRSASQRQRESGVQHAHFVLLLCSCVEKLVSQWLLVTMLYVKWKT